MSINEQLWTKLMLEAGCTCTAFGVWTVPKHVDMKAIDRKVMELRNGSA